MIFADSHSHFDFDEYESERALYVSRMHTAGVRYVIVPNVDLNTLPKVISICKRYPNFCYPSIGLHPTDVGDDYRSVLDTMFSSLYLQERFYAIGECGIDLYWDKTRKDQQIDAFEIQLAYAKRMRLPLIIHSRQAFEECLSILKRPENVGIPGVFHCFSGSLEQAKRVIDLGFKLGIGGVVTFKNSTLWQVVEAIDLKDLLLETDAPFIAPHPHRGTRNESSYIPLIAARIAAVKGVTMETVANVTTENTTSLFGLH